MSACVTVGMPTKKVMCALVSLSLLTVIKKTKLVYLKKKHLPDIPFLTYFCRLFILKMHKNSRYKFSNNVLKRIFLQILFSIIPNLKIFKFISSRETISKSKITKFTSNFKTLMSVQTVPIHVLKMQIVQTPKEATHVTVKTASKTKVVTEETAPVSITS